MLEDLSVKKNYKWIYSGFQQCIRSFGGPEKSNLSAKFQDFSTMSFNYLELIRPLTIQSNCKTEN